MLPIIIDLKLI